MILLCRLDGREFWLNEDLVVSLEETPDTLVTLTTGARVWVRESVGEVLERIVAFRRRVLGDPAALVVGGAAAAKG